VAASGSEADDSDNNPAAYNHSIYLMVGVPYLSFSVVGLLIWRGCKKNAEYLRALQQGGQTTA